MGEGRCGYGAGALEGLQMMPSKWKHRKGYAKSPTREQKVRSRKYAVLIVIANTGSPNMNGPKRLGMQCPGFEPVTSGVPGQHSTN